MEFDYSKGLSIFCKSEDFMVWSFFGSLNLNKPDSLGIHKREWLLSPTCASYSSSNFQSTKSPFFQFHSNLISSVVFGGKPCQRLSENLSPLDLHLSTCFALHPLNSLQVARQYFPLQKALLTFSHRMCMGSAILFFCMASTVLPGLEVSISGPFRTFKALGSMPSGPHDLAIWLV